MVNAGFIQTVSERRTRLWARTGEVRVLTLAEYRSKHGITQPEMAQMLGVSAQSISRWERGLCEPRSYIIRRIQRVTDDAVTFKDWQPSDEAA